ncbi:fungal specific transcription factor factor [Fusarium denticulatum]|uniref:Fungal specific transcription factor factor n=1 Tax=Fusarium denticulatum TaxID=48507 RepID=A0A8H5XIQ9_9HYPO|nr:fungal specific transcription factor factor [Fusarium denticulatum]
MSSSSNIAPEMERRCFKVINRKLNGIECRYVLYAVRVKDAPEPDANETESSRLGGRIETAEGSSERILSYEECRNELEDFTNEGKNRRSEADDVDMVGTEDEPFNFNTVRELRPREGYHNTSDVQDQDPNDEQDHELPKLPRLARMYDIKYWRGAPPSCSGLPSRYTQFHQELIINDYFEAFNQATPLFSELNYEDFHTHCIKQGNKGDEWCAIHVMLALSMRNDPGNHSIGDDWKFIRSAYNYVNNQYDLTGETAIQIVLGIAPYYMTTPHLERAGFMHSMAVKMVYKLEFHKMFGESVKSVWIAYIIDRDLSLLTGEPYLMQEHDIDPSVTDLSDEDGGILYSQDNSLRFEIFKFRARLATIQGKIFDLVYSVRASQLSFDRRETVADRLDDMLEKWVESIPEPFRGDTIPGFSHEQMRFLRQLHVTYYHCMFCIRQATLRNIEWVDRLLSFGEARKPDNPDTPLLPSNWSGLVTAARRCLDIGNKVDSRDSAFRWSCTHATQAAMTILAANNITLSEHDLHDSTEKDQQRLHIAHGEVSDRIQEDPTGAIEQSFNTCGELIIKTRESVQRFNESKQIE